MMYQGYNYPSYQNSGQRQRNPPATAFNPTSFVSTSPANDQRMNYYYNNYYQTATKNEVPIALSWQVNAYVELEKKGLIKKCCTKDEQDLPKNLSDVPYPYQNFYHNPQGHDVKHILKNVQGIVQPGQLCAIMGASGSGKTSLLNILNFRNRGKIIVDGDVRINGQPIGWKEVTACSGYVQQEDVFMGTLKVKEHLMFLAALKLDKSLSYSQKMSRVEQVMRELNLTHVQDTLIGQGDRLRGISGGEKRRVAFASEILNNPMLLFADEPTSGLDSFMAQSIVDSMALIAQQGKTVISTIHQPSSQIFEKFDVLCLLSEGRVAYMGPSREAANFFQSLNYPLPDLYNPADHYIQVLAIFPEKREESLQKVTAICDSFERSKYHQDITNAINQSVAQASHIPISRTKLYHATLGSQIYWLFWRQIKCMSRDPISTKVLLIQTIVIGLFLGLIYLRTTLNETGVQNISGLIFILLMQTSFGYIFPIINSFPFELEVFYREIKNRLYSTTPYYFAKQLTELPKYLLFVLIQFAIAYWMAGVNNTASVFFIVASFFLLSNTIATGFGFLASVLAPSVDAAVGIAGPALLPLLIFAGFFLNNSSVPNYFIWLKYISFFYYAFEAILIELWRGVGTIPCTIPVDYRNCTSARCFRDGHDVLDLLQVNPSHLERDIGLLFLLAVLPRILCLIALKIKVARFK